jgi:uncharacterized membrane protein
VRVLAVAAVVVGALIAATAVVLFVAAIWTVGPDSSRLAGTAAVVLFVGGVLGVTGVAWLDLNPRREP